MVSGFSGVIDSASQSSNETSSPAAESVIPVSNCEVVNVIWAGGVYTYTIPTFTVVSVNLRHVEGRPEL